MIQWKTPHVLCCPTPLIEDEELDVDGSEDNPAQVGDGSEDIEVLLDDEPIDPAKCRNA